MNLTDGQRGDSIRVPLLSFKVRNPKKTKSKLNRCFNYNYVVSAPKSTVTEAGMHNFI